jgi:hypothetical protein
MDEKKIKSYRELLIWQKGIELVKEVYKLTKNSPEQKNIPLLTRYIDRLFLFHQILLRGRQDNIPKNLSNFFIWL